MAMIPRTSVTQNMAGTRLVCLLSVLEVSMITRPFPDASTVCTGWNQMRVAVMAIGRPAFS